MELKPRIIILKSNNEDFVLSLKDVNTLVVAFQQKPVLEAETGQLINTDTGEIFTMQIIKKTQEIPAMVEWLDSEGDPAPVKLVTWSVANPTVGHLTDDPGADVNKKNFVADTVGTTQLSVTSFPEGADETDLSKQITVLGDIQVLPGDAETGEMTFGTPVDTVPAPPTP